MHLIVYDSKEGLSDFNRVIDTEKSKFIDPQLKDDFEYLRSQFNKSYTRFEAYEIVIYKDIRVVNGNGIPGWIRRLKEPERPIEFKYMYIFMFVFLLAFICIVLGFSSYYVNYEKQNYDFDKLIWLAI